MIEAVEALTGIFIGYVLIVALIYMGGAILKKIGDIDVTPGFKHMEDKEDEN